MPLPFFDQEPNIVKRILMANDRRDEDDRLKRFAAAWKAYTGEANLTLDVPDGEVDDNVTVPYEQVVVNKGRSYLFGKGQIKFELEAGTKEGQQGQQTQSGQLSTAEEYLKNVWRNNRMKTTLLKMATNGGVFGHCFIKVVSKHPYPRVVVLDPATVTPYWNDEDIEDVIGYKVQYNTWDDDGEPIVRRELMERIERTPEEVEVAIPAPAPEVKPPAGQEQAETAVEPTAEEGEQGTPRPRVKGAPAPPEVVFNLPVQEVDPEPFFVWEVRLEESSPMDNEWHMVEKYTWPYPWAPIHQCQNLPMPNEFWGQSDIELATLKLNRSISRLLSNLNRIIRLHAHPKLFTIGLSEVELRTVELDLRPDAMVNLPNPNADLKSVEMQSDLSSSVELYKRLKEVYHEVTRVPEIATGKVDNTGTLSGVALSILYGPLMELTEDKRCTYGDMLRELNQHLLELGNFGEEVWVETQWPELLPNDPVAEGAALLQDSQLGVSKRTLMEKRGYDPEREKKLASEEAEVALEQNEAFFSAGESFGTARTGKDKDQESRVQDAERKAQEAEDAAKLAKP